MYRLRVLTPLAAILVLTGGCGESAPTENQTEAGANRSAPGGQPEIGATHSSTTAARGENAPAADGHHGAEWGYAGSTGPEHWAERAEENRVCANGQQNSPVDLRNPIAARLGALETSYAPVPLTVSNTGHSIQVEMAEGGTMRVGGKQYNLVQMHLHHPSEHLLNGQRFPMEAHFVHQGPDGILGVIAVFFTPGRPNPALQRVLDAMPRQRSAGRRIEGPPIRASDFMPPSAGRSFFRYEGSLTTPPCSENVDWVVLSELVEVSPAQVTAFESVYPFNARPLQALNRRFLLRSE